MSVRQTKKQRIIARRREELKWLSENVSAFSIIGAEDVVCKLFDFGWGMGLSVTAPDGMRKAWRHHIHLNKRASKQLIIREFEEAANEWLSRHQLTE